jgi:hypothetical protein
MSHMRRQRLRWLVLLAVAWLQGLAPAAALADSASSAAQASYQEQIRRALQEYELGHWNEAKAFFAEAHAMQPSARTLRGLGLTSYELRDYVAAIGYATRALADNVRPLTEEMLKEMRGILEQSEHFVGHAHLVLEPKSAIVRVDGKAAVVEADGRLLLNPGSHELVSQAPGFESAARTVQTESGDNLEVELTLRPASLAAPGSNATLGASTTSEVAATTHASVAPWVVVGIAGAVTVTGVVLLALSMSDISSVENARKGSSWSDVKSANDSAPTLSAIGLVMLGTGVAGVAAGLAWKFWPRKTEREASAALHVVPGGVRLAGTF